MNRTALIVSSIVMSFAALLFLSEARKELNGSKETQEVADFWKSRVAREQLRKLIVKGQFADFKQDTALLLPSQIQKVKADQEKQRLRNLASVIPHEGSQTIVLGVAAQSRLKSGKARGVKHEYRKGVDDLKKLIEKFPDSVHVVEAHYLIIESYAQMEKNMNLVMWVEKMVELFPDNRMTGYALLKIGSLYELEGRHDDAIRIYRTIVSAYDDNSLIEKAQKAVKSLDL